MALGPIMWCVVLLATAWAYLPALTGDFIWDDADIYLVNNLLLSRADGLYRFWFTTEPYDYYPLTYTTFWLEYRLWGLWPTGYHLVNLGLHLTTGWLVCRLCRRWELPALLAAAVFLLHPLQVESVAWISQRKTLLATLFGVLATLAWLDDRRPKWRLVKVWGYFFLSLASKPTLIFLPLILGLLHFVRRQHWRRQEVVMLIGLFLLAGGLGAIGAWFQAHRVIGEESVRAQGPAERFLAGSAASGFYLWSFLWPTKLFFVYPRWSHETVTELGGACLLGWIFVGLVSAVMPTSWRRGGLTLVGIYLLTLLPALGVVDVYYWRYSYVADHYSHPATVALAVAVGLAWARFAGGCPWLSRVLGCGLLIGLTVLTRQQSGLYCNEETIWKDVIAKNPQDFLGHNNLGAILLKRGDRRSAMRCFQIACERHPNYYEAIRNCALCRRLERDWPGALQLGQRAVDLMPKNPDGYLELARTHRARGDGVAAQQALVRFVERNVGELTTPPARRRLAELRAELMADE